MTDPGIPRIIMQTWKTNTLPKHWQASQDAIKRILPHWKYHLQTDANNLAFVVKYFPDFLDVFMNFPYPIQRADAIRYMWLYVHGGVYLDLDLEIVQDIASLFRPDGDMMNEADLYVVKSGFMPNVYTNAFIAAKPRQSVMLECLRLMSEGAKIWHIGKHLEVINSTGPNMFTQAVIGHRLVNYDFNVVELPPGSIIACTICEAKPCWRPGAYCRTLGGSSWSGNDTECLTTIYCNRKKIVAVGIVILLVIIAIVIGVILHRRSRK